MLVLTLTMLVLTAASVLAMATVVFTPFVFGLFLLALVGVIAQHGDRRVPPRQPPADADAWRGPA